LELSNQKIPLLLRRWWTYFQMQTKIRLDEDLEFTYQMDILILDDPRTTLFVFESRPITGTKSGVFYLVPQPELFAYHGRMCFVRMGDEYVHEKI